MPEDTLHLVCAHGSSGSVAATARAAVQARREPHLRRHACSTLLRRMQFSLRALALPIESGRIVSPKRIFLPPRHPTPPRVPECVCRRVLGTWLPCVSWLSSLWLRPQLLLVLWVGRPSSKHKRGWYQRPIGHNQTRGRPPPPPNISRRTCWAQPNPDHGTLVVTLPPASRRSWLRHSPKQTPSFPRSQPVHQLRGGGHWNRVEGHTGNCARKGGGEDDDDARGGLGTSAAPSG